ncbi:uncharacterized protein ACB058_011148 [Synchiropus picturatus]
MNWDNQLSSILSAADGSVAKMRERLASPRKLCQEDLFPERERSHYVHLDPPALPPRASLHHQPSSSVSRAVQWSDIAAVQSQVQLQNQAIESLTKRLYNMERERQSHQSHIQALQEEVDRLREELRYGEREMDEVRKTHSPGVEKKMEQWRREVGRELSSLRGHIARATSLGNLEESFSSNVHRDEMEHLRREVDQLKVRLSRQEEDLFSQQMEAREARRQYDRTCKTLQELTDSYRSHSTDLAKTVSQYSQTRQEFRQVSATVSELKEEVHGLLRENDPSTLSPQASGLSPAHHQRRGVTISETKPDSDSDDFSPTPSLAEISSDDLSWLDDKEQTIPQKSTVRLSVQSRKSNFSSPGTDLEDEDEDSDDLLGDDAPAESESDLSLNDLSTV